MVVTVDVQFKRYYRHSPYECVQSVHEYDSEELLRPRALTYNEFKTLKLLMDFKATEDEQVDELIELSEYVPEALKWLKEFNSRFPDNIEYKNNIYIRNSKPCCVVGADEDYRHIDFWCYYDLNRAIGNVMKELEC